MPPNAMKFRDAKKQYHQKLLSKSKRSPTSMGARNLRGVVSELRVLRVSMAYVMEGGSAVMEGSGLPELILTERNTT
ncbi:hypothetical protein EVAR_38657_1 [Eumeta japonica]|uniref:Uncharacterized protein n=1 Tax=Eumeta variegata TaxID=151549 RepID=A0A4C1XYX0_EUMVA|nr:hypothetical protein EVAR_38657_1 [Eumeta japonica]